jgi:hypothetical protein
MEELIKAGLYDNLNQIALELISLWKLEFKQQVEHLSDPLHRWLDFRMRYIDAMPRTVHYSSKFPINLPHTVQVGLDSIVAKLTSGADINPYQSKWLTRFSDSSGKRSAKRTDLLWADWGILHLHITDVELIPDDSEFYSRRDCSDGEAWLLFCIITGKEIGLIDVRRHKEKEILSDIDMLRIIKSSWPVYLEQFRFNGMLPGRDLTNDDIKQLRNGGLTYSITLGEHVYMPPGMGVTSASTPLKITVIADKILNRIDYLAGLICSDENALQAEIKKLDIHDPKFALRLTPTGVILCELGSNTGFTFTQQQALKHHDDSKILEELFCPPWAVKGMRPTQNES